MSERTKDEIKRELGALEELVEDVTSPMLALQLEAHIRVLKEWSHLPSHELADRIDGAWPQRDSDRRDHDLHEAATEMEEWLNGDWDPEDHEDAQSPSEEWRKS